MEVARLLLKITKHYSVSTWERPVGGEPSFTGPYTLLVVGSELSVVRVKRTGFIVLKNNCQSHTSMNIQLYGFNSSFFFSEGNFLEGKVLRGKQFLKLEKEFSWGNVYWRQNSEGQNFSRVEFLGGRNFTAGNFPRGVFFREQILQGWVVLEPRETHLTKSVRRIWSSQAGNINTLRDSCAQLLNFKLPNRDISMLEICKQMRALAV